jgi:hypothetical protein
MKIARSSHMLGENSKSGFVKVSRVPSGRSWRPEVNTKPMKKRAMKGLLISSDGDDY